MDTSECLRLTIEYTGEGFWFSHFVKPPGDLPEMPSGYAIDLYTQSQTLRQIASEAPESLREGI